MNIKFPSLQFVTTEQEIASSEKADNFIRYTATIVATDENSGYPKLMTKNLESVVHVTDPNSDRVSVGCCVMVLGKVIKSGEVEGQVRTISSRLQTKAN